MPEFAKTKQGVELQFQVNHLGPFLLTNLLVHALLKSSFGPSVVNIASAGHRASGVRFDDINFKVGTVPSVCPKYMLMAHDCKGWGSIRIFRRLWPIEDCQHPLHGFFGSETSEERTPQFRRRPGQ